MLPEATDRYLQLEPGVSLLSCFLDHKGFGCSSCLTDKHGKWEKSGSFSRAAHCHLGLLSAASRRRQQQEAKSSASHLVNSWPRGNAAMSPGAAHRAAANSHRDQRDQLLLCIFSSGSTERKSDLLQLSFSTRSPEQTLKDSPEGTVLAVGRTSLKQAGRRMWDGAVTSSNKLFMHGAAWEAGGAGMHAPKPR